LGFASECGFLTSEALQLTQGELAFLTVNRDFELVLVFDFNGLSVLVIAFFVAVFVVVGLWSFLGASSSPSAASSSSSALSSLAGLTALCLLLPSCLRMASQRLQAPQGSEMRLRRLSPSTNSVFSVSNVLSDGCHGQFSFP
jgi:hypothetical protein